MAVVTSDKTPDLQYFILIGRSHGELGPFTVLSLPLRSDEMRSAEMKSDELR